MIKLLVLLFSLLPAPAHAGVPCSVPFNLTNGTTADASQVMANYNAILSCLSSGAAASGANSDITSLASLTTPLSPAQGGSTIFAGGTSTGTNAITIAATTPNNFALVKTYCVTFVAGGSNTGAVTLNVISTGVTNVLKNSPSGPIPLIGGEIVTGQMGMACYDGTQFELSPQATYSTLIDTNQVVTGGATVNPTVNGNLGTLSTGTTTINCGRVPLQFFTNNGTFTLAAPVNDGSCVLLMTNGATAVVPTLTGFTVGTNIGDTVAATNTFKYFLSVTRINGIASYFWKALQ